jgi:hypothetical protein
VSRETDGPGRQLPGPSEDDAPGGAAFACMITDGASGPVPPWDGLFKPPLDDETDPASPNHALGDPGPYRGPVRRHPRRDRFGQPSNYSLSARELAAHVRRLRSAGWQSWEIRTRFDFWPAA